MTDYTRSNNHSDKDHSEVLNGKSPKSDARLLDDIMCDNPDYPPPVDSTDGDPVCNTHNPTGPAIKVAPKMSSNGHHMGDAQHPHEGGNFSPATRDGDSGSERFI